MSFLQDWMPWANEARQEKQKSRICMDGLVAEEGFDLPKRT